MKNYFVRIIFHVTLVFLQINTSAQPVKFKHLSMEDGLSNNLVYSVVQDFNGFIWFGTSDGLNRYDGYNIKVFRNNPENPNSISDNGIWALHLDCKGNLWVGTKCGAIDRYDPISEKFTHWKIDSDIGGENSIKSLVEDKNGKIWIGTYKDGLYCLNPVTDSIQHWVAERDNPKSLSTNYNQYVIEDASGNILIGTYHGLNIFNPEKPEEGFARIFYEGNESLLSNNIIWGLTKSNIDSNIIWIGTASNITKYNAKDKSFEIINVRNKENIQYGNSSGTIYDEIVDGEIILWISSYAGLVRMNTATGKSIRFIHNDNMTNSISSNYINMIFKDKADVLWAVTENGISYKTNKSSSFNYLILNDQNKYIDELVRKNITAISIENKNKVWVGTTDGLYFLSRISEEYSIGKIDEFNNIYIWSLLPENNNLWIGTYGKGLKRFNQKLHKTSEWDVTKERFITMAPYYIKVLKDDEKGNIWVGYWAAGLAKINPKTREYKLFVNDPGNRKSLSHNDIWAIEEDKLGRIWIGTLGGGLNLYEETKSDIFHIWDNSGNNNNNIYSNNIHAIHEEIISLNRDSNVVLWIGTSDGLIRFEVTNGLNLYDAFDFKVNIKQYTTNNGLPNNTVNSIKEDLEGNLWLGTSSGISYFNQNNETFTNFTSEDGINGFTMNPGSAEYWNDDIMIFGSTLGINLFRPKKIKRKHDEIVPVFSDFQIFNESVIYDNSIFGKSIQATKEIELSYNQDVFSFEFATLDYNSPRSINYAYMMEGFDDDWIFCGFRRHVTYTNLEAGEYVFKIKSTNADGIWGENYRSITVIIKPPFWKTWWAHTIYVLLFLFSYFSVRRYEMNKRKKEEENRLRIASEKAKLKQSELRAEAAEYKSKMLEKEKEIEKQQIRNRISKDLHDEIGSNLSSIILLSSLIGKNQNSDGKLKRYISEIHGAAKLSAESIRDIVWLINPASDHVGKLFTRLQETANTMLGDINKDLSCTNLSSGEKLRPDIKRNIFLIYKEILNNIIKHSKADSVEIDIAETEGMMKIVVSDNGIGFNPKKDTQGNGLRNLKYRAEQINGNLEIKSTENIGTQISFTYNIT